MKIAVYPGSFDPVTNGHIDIIDRAAKIFKVVYVAVLKNTGKTPHFTLKDRILMLKKTLGDRKNIRIESFDGLLVDFAAEKKAHAIIRGLRAVSDFDYEFQMALTNAQMNRDIETVFLMTGHKYSYLSSSLVLQIAALGGDVSRFVPKIVREKLAGGRKWKES